MGLFARGRYSPFFLGTNSFTGALGAGSQGEDIFEPGLLKIISLHWVSTTVSNMDARFIHRPGFSGY